MSALSEEITALAIVTQPQGLAVSKGRTCS